MEHHVEKENSKSAFFSICIPTYEMHGMGAEYLQFSFEQIKIQRFKDFEVIVSDHSSDGSIEKVCKAYEKYFPLLYIKNKEKRGNSSANINVAIQHASGQWIKVLFQDDYLLNEDSLFIHFQHLENVPRDKWLACGTMHTINGETLLNPHLPSYHSRIYLGKNTIGAPTNITFPNKVMPSLFDEKLIWLMDCDFYKRLELYLGQPILVNSFLVVNRIGEHQVTQSLINEEIIKREERYLTKKYFWNRWLGIPLKETRKIK